MGKKVEHITPTQAGQQQENDGGRSYGVTSLSVFTLIWESFDSIDLRILFGC
jgi:hypothetical protein